MEGEHDQLAAEESVDNGAVPIQADSLLLPFDASVPKTAAKTDQTITELETVCDRCVIAEF